MTEGVRGDDRESQRRPDSDAASIHTAKSMSSLLSADKLDLSYDLERTDSISTHDSFKNDIRVRILCGALQ